MQPSEHNSSTSRATPATAWGLFVELLRPYRSSLALYGLLLTIVTAIPLAGAILLGRFVDLVQERAPVSQLAWYAAIYGLLGLCSALTTIVVTQQSTGLSWRITDGLRHRLADQVLRADLSFHRDNSPGSLVGRADDDVSAMAVVLSQFAAKVLAVVAIGVGATIALAFIQPLLAGPYAICVACSFGLLWEQRNDAIPTAMHKRQVMGDLSGFIEERFGGTDDISSLGAGAHVVSQLADRSDELINATYAATSVNMRIVASLKIMLSLGEVVMIAWGATLFFSGRVGLGAVFIGWRFAEALKTPVEQLTWRLSEVQDANGSAERVIELLQADRSHPERIDTLPAGQLALRFDDVSFTYDDGDQPVLDHLTLEVSQGRSLGLVGRSGSGKTSIGRIALRIVEPSTGVFLLGGIDVRSITEEHFRARVTAVPQDVQLLPGTIRENVTLFADVDDDRIIDAITRVGLHPWLQAQSLGLDSRLLSGSEAAGMSAGQAQLLAMARALVRDPDVVVLDEASSRIDPATQRQIAAATAELLHQRTSIVIAHRLETLFVCDDIAVIEGGRIIEHGDQQTLRADPISRFARLLAAAQTLNESDGAGLELDELLGDEPVPMTSVGLQ